MIAQYKDAYIAGFKLGIKDFLDFWTIKSWLTGWMIRILSNMLIWVYLAKLTGSSDSLEYLVIGNCTVAALGTFAPVVASWERYSGTLPLLISSPAPIWLPIFGRMTIWAVNWYFTSVLCFTVCALYFGYPSSIDYAELASLLVVLTLVCLSTLTFCAFVGALVSARPQLRLIVGWGVITLIMAFTGAITPTTIWPRAVQLFVSILPVSNGLTAIRLISDHKLDLTILSLSLRELAIAMLWLSLAIAAFNRSARVIVKTGRSDLGS